MMPRPCRMHILTESALRAWAHTRTPEACAISIAAATSASVITARSARLSGVARDVELEEIGPLADEEATDLSHFVGPVGDPRERRRLDVGQMQLVLVAEPAGDGDLRPVGEIARAREAPGVELVADHDVETRRGRGDRQHPCVAA